MQRYDLLSIGRSGLDLYSNDVGAPFVDIKGFAAYVGGSPTSTAIGARRLGLDVALLTAVGNDPVGDFVLHILEQEGVDTRYIPRKRGTRTGAVVLGIEPPDKFPLVFYRDNAADIQLGIDDVLAAPLGATRVLAFAGTNLSKEPIRSATLHAAEVARQSGATIVLDLDFRPDQWHDPRAFGVAIRSALRLVDILIGTEDEINAALLSNPQALHVAHSQMSAARVRGDTAQAIPRLLAHGPQVLIEKRGARGSRAHLRSGEQFDAPGYTVPVYNVVGAGDAFAAGCLYGFLKGWDWPRALRMGNACGAIVVTRHGCASAMASADEVTQFIQAHGGF